MTIRTALASIIALYTAACGDHVDYSYKTGLLVADDFAAERVSASEPALMLVSLFVRNDTSFTVNSVSNVTYRADDTEAAFDFNVREVVNCGATDPWDVPPGEIKEMRMRLDLREDPAVLLLACDFNPDVPGFDSLSAQQYTAPRIGPAPSAEFTGPLDVELEITLDAPCTPDDCSAHALVRASAMVDSSL